MKQALTAGGLISVWFESAKIALEKLDINFEENLDLPQLAGIHPEYGEITIDFFVPVQGKTRMEITVQDAALIAAFKKNVVPAFKYVSALAAQQIETEPEAESEDSAAQEQESQCTESEENAQEPAGETEVLPETLNEGSSDQGDSVDEQQDAAQEQDAVKEENAVKERDLKAMDHFAAEVKPMVKHCKYCQAELQDGAKICPECGKKQKKKGPLIAGIIIVILVLIGAAGFAAFKLTGGQDFSFAKIKALIFGSSSTTETADSSQLISSQQFNQIQKGMTYDAICSALGSQGTFLEPETQLTYSDGSVVTLKTYYWNAQGSDGANICITFTNGVAEVISQTGLQ